MVESIARKSSGALHLPSNVIRQYSIKLKSSAWILLLILAGTGAFIAAFVAFQTGRQYEIRRFEDEFESVIRLVVYHVQDELNHTASYLRALRAPFVRRRPWDATINGTDVPGLPYWLYQETAKGLRGSSGARAFVYLPNIFTAADRAFVEDFMRYATANNIFGVSNTTLRRMVDQSDTGIRMNDPGETGSAVRVPESEVYSPPLTPVIYLDPYEGPDDEDNNFAGFGFDFSSEYERRVAITLARDTGDAVMTGFLVLIPDLVRGLKRASSIIFAPALDDPSDPTARATGGRPPALVCMNFSWDQLFSRILPRFTFSGLVLVLTAVNPVNVTSGPYTFFLQGNVTERGKGRLLGSAIRAYRRTHNLTMGATTYILEVYPMPEFQDRYFTDSPRNLCIIVICFTVASAAVFLLFHWWSQRQRTSLENVATGALDVLDDILPPEVGRVVVGDKVFPSQRNTNQGAAPKGWSRDAKASQETGGSAGSRAGLQKVARGSSTRPAMRSTVHRNSVNSVQTAGVLRSDGGVGSAGTRTTVSSGPGVHEAASGPGEEHLGAGIENLRRHSLFSSTNSQRRTSMEPDVIVTAAGAVSVRARSRVAPLPAGGGGLRVPEGPKVIADYFPATTVFFMDVVGFTTWSANQAPTSVLTLLDSLFAAVDRLIDQEAPDVYKIDTIGDAYLAATGVPRRSRRHAEQAADFALLILSKMEEIREVTGIPDLKVRIGLHSGPVTAGVLRSGKRLKYSIYGDTVNLASRMESLGEPLKIHISEDCATLLAATGAYVIEERGILEVKGKGPQRTFFLLGKAPESTQPSEWKPNTSNDREVNRQWSGSLSQPQPSKPSEYVELTIEPDCDRDAPGNNVKPSDSSGAGFRGGAVGTNSGQEGSKRLEGNRGV